MLLDPLLEAAATMPGWFKNVTFLLIVTGPVLLLGCGMVLHMLLNGVVVDSYKTDLKTGERIEHTWIEWLTR